MGLYEFLIKDKSGNTLASLDGARNRRYDLFLNKSGSASFVMTTKDAKISQDLFLVGNKELFIYRTGTLMWGGELNITQSELSEGNESITINAKGFLELLNKRYIGSSAIPRLFTDTDLATIAWTIIDESQSQTNGDFGITQGVLPTTRNADRTYEYKNLKEAIEGLSNLNIQNGVDFEISPDKKFSVYYPQKGAQKDEVVFEWGVNIAYFSESQDATAMANRVIVLGEGQGTELKTVTRNSSDVIQANYKIRENVVSFKDVNQTATLNDHGDRELSSNQIQQQIISLKTKGNLNPPLGSYSLGDIIRIKVQHGIINVDSYFRIYGISVSISDEDEEEVELIFNPN